jgi:hypothetical protein
MRLSGVRGCFDCRTGRFRLNVEYLAIVKAAGNLHQDIHRGVAAGAGTVQRAS